VPGRFSEILAPDCNEWQNECQSRLTSNLVSAGNLRHINIIVVQTGKLIFVGSKIAAPLNFAALFGRTPRTCLRPALHIWTLQKKACLTVWALCIVYWIQCNLTLLADADGPRT